MGNWVIECSMPRQKSNCRRTVNFNRKYVVVWEPTKKGLYQYILMARTKSKGFLRINCRKKSISSVINKEWTFKRMTEPHLRPYWHWHLLLSSVVFSVFMCKASKRPKIKKWNVGKRQTWLWLLSVFQCHFCAFCVCVFVSTLLLIHSRLHIGILNSNYVNSCFKNQTSFMVTVSSQCVRAVKQRSVIQ